MKRILLIVMLLTGVLAQAQPFNNEWIDYSKTYYKFKLAVTGLYRIPQSTLAAVGMSNANADHFQLWRNGVEIPIYTTSTNAPLAANGYIEFWGQMNDGKADLPLYRNPNWQLDDFYSLQTDSATYFLTINSTSPNKRLVQTANEVATNTLPKEEYFMHKVETHYHAKVHSGRVELVGSSYTYSSTYDIGEGWTSTDLAGNATTTVNYSAMRPYVGAGAPDINVSVFAAGNAINQRYFRVALNGDSIMGQQMDYYSDARAVRTLPVSAIASGSAQVAITNRSTGSADRMVLSKISIEYPRIFDFGAAARFAFELPASAVGNYIEINNFPTTGADLPVLYDLTNGQRYSPTTTAAPFRFRLTASATKRSLVMVSVAPVYVTSINQLTERNFVNYLAPEQQGNFLMIASALLTAATGSYDPVEEYRQYRSSAEGGSYNAKVYLIDQLEDQFAFGIAQHPLSVRNFVHWTRANYSESPKYVLLIGRASTYNQFYLNQNKPETKFLCQVPTFGYPASDNLLTAQTGSSIPLVPIGRVSAISKDELGDYLSKLKQFEQLYDFNSPLISEKGWKKNVVHVVGAGDNNTSSLLTAALDGHKAIIEDTLYAANVHTFSKTSADAVEQVASIRLAKLFEEGIGVLTYFGHSSSNALEFNLDNPQAYNNPGKYPVMIVMGCNAGSFYNYNVARLQTMETISEKFVLAQDRGSVAFLASTHLGIIHYLDIYNTRTYRAMSRSFYGATLGEIMDEAIRQTFALTTENDFYARFQCEQFTLHGDPAIRLYTADKPDYAIEESMVNVDPKFIPVSNIDFNVTARFVNLGRAIDKPIVVEVSRTFPNGTTELFRRDTIPFRRYQDSLTYTLPVMGVRDQGLNKITIRLDADDEVDELYESNNVIVKDVYIIEDDIRPAYPYRYSIVSDPNVKLIASTANPFAAGREYRMEIDTTVKFNSPLKSSQNRTVGGGIVEFEPGISFTDSTVYYWRISPTVTSGEPVWNLSSFQYIANGANGFSQAHFDQHQNSQMLHVRLEDNREWRFDSVVNNLFVKNGVWGSAITTAGELVVNVNDSSYIRNSCIYGLIFNVFDEKTFKPWKNQLVGSTGMYGSQAPCATGGTSYNFEFPNTRAGRNAAMLFLRSIPDGNFVVLRNQARQLMAQNEYANQWLADELTYGAGNSMYTELKNQGFTDIDSINKPRAFSLVYKKNKHGEHPTQFIISAGIYDAINLSVDCISPRSLAFITSPTFGPAKAWTELHWRGKDQHPTTTDSPLIDIIGIRADGSESEVVQGIGLNNQDYDVSGIDAVEYPYIKLRMANQDTVNYDPYQLRYWMVTYNPVPEGAIAPNLYFTTRDTVEVGEPFNFGIAFKNVSRVQFDSIKVKLSITDQNNIENIVPIPNQKDLAVGDTIKLNVPIDTRGLAGFNTLFVNFNPDRAQPEQHLFNNYAFRTLYVRPDSLQPMLDVTFDGVHILNRDIVAARPTIVAELKDEAKWLLLNDTSLLNVQVKYPDGYLRRFNFDNDTLQFEPASDAGNNSARIQFKPYFLEDGEYELLISGKDRSENAAGFVQYRVAFQVINKPMISNMLNYPNPFTTSTAFVFTVTGSEVPQNIRIQILTITGKVVREITKEELGPLHIGRNITEFKWDGTDQYGQKLANGVYLYRVITNHNGKTLDKYKAQGDNTDKYFNKGYGKMYLMR
ncbi:MAG: C25 family cysteine peptidase [Chitinophagaceae bacterium]